MEYHLGELSHTAVFSYEIMGYIVPKGFTKLMMQNIFKGRAYSILTDIYT